METEDSKGIAISGMSLDSIGRLVANVGLPVVIVLVLLWPAMRMLNAQADAIPQHAEAARSNAETHRVIADVLVQLNANQKALIDRLTREDRRNGSEP